MQEHKLLVLPHLRLKARGHNQLHKGKLRATRPNQFWGTDMTKIMIPWFGWLYLVIVLDWYAKKLVGYTIASHCRTEARQAALTAACNTQFPNGAGFRNEALYVGKR